MEHVEDCHQVTIPQKFEPIRFRNKSSKLSNSNRNDDIATVSSFQQPNSAFDSLNDILYDDSRDLNDIKKKMQRIDSTSSFHYNLNNSLHSDTCTEDSAIRNSCQELPFSFDDSFDSDVFDNVDCNNFDNTDNFDNLTTESLQQARK